MTETNDASATSAAPADVEGGGSGLGEVWRAFLLLGLTSFGGPVAHLGYFRAEFVERRRWLADADYADIVALCQVLPGPTSSQVGFLVGLRQAGWSGALAAWVTFTGPSAVIMLLLALGYDRIDVTHGVAQGLIHGLKVAAVAVVAMAIHGLARTLWGDRERASIGIAAAATLLVVPGVAAQLAVIAGAAVVGAIALRATVAVGESVPAVAVSRRAATVCLGLFVALMVALPVAAAASGSAAAEMVAGVGRAGTLVFGGGHVMLPLLEPVAVGSGQVTPDAFAAGYGLAQAIPGPMFTFATFLGGVAGGVPLALLATVLIFIPSFLLAVAVLPFHAALRRRPRIGAALAGVNAAVVGILIAAFYDPIWTSAILRPVDVALALVALAALAWWRVPAWAVVIGAALAGIVVAP